MKALIYLGILGLLSCSSQSRESNKEDKLSQTVRADSKDSGKVTAAIHVLVALCDNQYQGIVKVPEKIGNGQNPDANLYWGCGYGVRSFFIKSPNWKLIRKIKASSGQTGDTAILERVIFKHKTSGRYLIADAYNGKYIERCTRDLIAACAGQIKDTVMADGKVLGILGYSDLITYTGHDGLMDFSFSEKVVSDDVKRKCIILACYSKNYFRDILIQTKVQPLVWTTGLMCPEAYTTHDAIEAYISGKSDEDIRKAAASAYSKYQKCSYEAARRLLSQGY